MVKPEKFDYVHSLSLYSIFKNEETKLYKYRDCKSLIVLPFARIFKIN